MTMHSLNSRRAINPLDEYLLHGSAVYAIHPGMLAGELALGRGGA